MAAGARPGSIDRTFVESPRLEFRANSVAQRTRTAWGANRGVASSEMMVLAGVVVALVIAIFLFFGDSVTPAMEQFGSCVGSVLRGSMSCGGGGGGVSASGGSQTTTHGTGPGTGYVGKTMGEYGNAGSSNAGSGGGGAPAGGVGGGIVEAAGGSGQTSWLTGEQVGGPNAGGGQPAPPPPGSVNGGPADLPLPPMPPGFVGTLGGVGSELYWDSGYGTGTSLHTTTARYGEWVGQGWSGGSTIPNKVGAKPPIDALDALAQQHDFAYAMAEEAGKLYGEKEKNRLLILADTIAYNEFQKLPKDPKNWVPLPPDLDKAILNRDRFDDTMYILSRQHNRAMDKAPPPTPEQAAALAAAGQMGPGQMQAEVNRRVVAWSKDRGVDMRRRGEWK